MREHEHDLVLTRTMKATRDQLWKAWTDPAILAEWWCPKPWTVTDVVMDLRAGGAFNMTMCGPDGERMPQKGSFLEVVEKKRIIFGDFFEANWVPAEEPFMTAIVTMEGAQDGVRYVARVRHRSAADKSRHDEMGFDKGWGAMTDQLEEIAKGL